MKVLVIKILLLCIMKKKTEGMKKGGCQCGCQAMTKSNCPDPTIKKKKPLTKNKPKPLIIKKSKTQIQNPY